MRVPLVYLAGPISGLDYKEATEWRDFATSSFASFGIECLSPMRAKHHLKCADSIPSVGSADKILCSNKGIVTRDKNDVLRSDVVLMNLLPATHVSVGTPVELGWADAYNIPVVVVWNWDKSPYWHAFTQELCGVQTSTLAEGIVATASLLNRA